MKNDESVQSDGKFGTFGGVFTPCTLTILGVIMFLRFGQIVGQSGLILGLVIVIAANLITTLTGLSLSAIATNTRVKGGGAYFLISRSLGMEFGGAIGIVFFLAQAISVSMYIVGFSEAFADAFPNVAISSVTLATITNVVIFLCVYIGAGWTIKVQYLILAILGLSLIAFFGGAASQIDTTTFGNNLAPDFQPGQSFFTMFALFFPAVTGIMAGANMSGDLRDPGRSIPTGTMTAIAVTTLVYIAMVFMFAAVRPSGELVANSLVIKEISWSAGLITAGVFAATLSSALGSMMGSPRILQAFARDRVFSWLTPLGRGSGASSEPRRATIVTFIVAQMCIMLGDLNAIAPVITMAFMITYGTLNLATFYEAITKNPSYRPRFRYCHWSLSLLGAIGCGAVMFLISPLWAIVSIAAMAGLHGLISWREIESRWGDMKSGLIFERTRRNLLRLEEQLHHPKNWRPIVLALSGGGWKRVHLAIYGHWLTAGHGILALGQVITGDIEDRADRRAAQERVLHGFISDQELEAFPAVVVSDSLASGIESLVQCVGLGALKTNTVLLGWPGDVEKVESFGATLRTISAVKQNIVTIRAREEVSDPWQPPAGTIDVWWRGKDNGPLMLMLAHLLTKNDPWRRHTIRLIRAVGSDEGRELVERHLIELLDSSRIRAVPLVLVTKNIAGALEETSASAAVVFLGMAPPAEGEEIAFFERVEQMTRPLPRVVLVNSQKAVELDK